MISLCVDMQGPECATHANLVTWKAAHLAKATLFAAHDISLTDMTLYHFKILHSHNDSEAHQSCTSNTAASQQTVH